jgi:copper chaperone CopZ
MKRIILIITLFLPLMAFAMTKNQTIEIEVSGKCGMCKERIEKAARVRGVSSASWSAETGILTMVYDQSRVNLDRVHQLIADAGHDTEKVKARDEIYNKLPACCKYERKAAEGCSSSSPAPARRACCGGH